MAEDNAQNELDLFLSELQEILEQNGAVPDKTLRRLNITGLKIIAMNIRGLPERVSKLESKNIVMLFERNPKRMAAITAFVTVVVMIVHEYFPLVWASLLKALGVAL